NGAAHASVFRELIELRDIREADVRAIVRSDDVPIFGESNDGENKDQTSAEQTAQIFSGPHVLLVIVIGILSKHPRRDVLRHVRQMGRAEAHPSELDSSRCLSCRKLTIRTPSNRNGTRAGKKPAISGR